MQTAILPRHRILRVQAAISRISAATYCLRLGAARGVRCDDALLVGLVDEIATEIADCIDDAELGAGEARAVRVGLGVCLWVCVCARARVRAAAAA